MKTSIIVIVSLVVGAFLGHHLFPNVYTEYTPQCNDDSKFGFYSSTTSEASCLKTIKKEISIIAEKKDCEKKGGRFEVMGGAVGVEGDVNGLKFKTEITDILCHAPAQPDIFNIEIN